MRRSVRAALAQTRLLLLILIRHEEAAQALLRVIFERQPNRLLVVTVFVSDRPGRYWQGEMP